MFGISPNILPISTDNIRVQSTDSEMRYDLTDLQIFLALARTLNMASAAEDVHRTVPAVSLRLKKLEEALGTTLFVREVRGLSLTPAGLAMVSAAEEVFAAVTRMEGVVGGYRDGVRPELRIASNTSGIQNYLAPAVGSFLREVPVRLVLLERKSSEAVQDVLAGRADLAFCTEAAARSHEDELEILPFALDRHVLVTPVGHPLADKESVDLQSMIAFPYVGLVETTPMGQAMRERTKALGLTYAPVVELPSFALMLDMVREGAGVGIVPRSALARLSDNETLCAVPISESWALRPLVFAHAKSKPLDETGRQFIEHLRRSDANRIKKGLMRP